MTTFPSILAAAHGLQLELAMAASRGAELNALVAIVDQRDPARVVAKLASRADARRIYSKLANGDPLNTATEIMTCLDLIDAPDLLRVIAFDSEVVISLPLVDFVRRTEIAFRGALNAMNLTTCQRPPAAN